jgi:hypothetical protein
MHGRVKEYLHAFLSSALDRAKCLVSCPCGFTPGTHQITGWMGHGTGLDAQEKRKISYPPEKSNTDFPVIQLTAQ